MYGLLMCSSGATAAASSMSEIHLFAADPREHGNYASQPPSVMFLRSLYIVERRTHLLRTLYHYRLAIDVCRLRGYLVPARCW